MGVLVSEHAQALNYDLLTRIGVSLYDIPDAIGWDDLRDFVTHLDASSALVSETHPDEAGWQGDQKIAMLLAHIADLIAGLSYSYTISHLKKGAKKPSPPEPIERPGVTKKKEKMRWGADAIPIRDFDAWWNEGRE